MDINEKTLIIACTNTWSIWDFAKDKVEQLETLVKAMDHQIDKLNLYRERIDQNKSPKDVEYYQTQLDKALKTNYRAITFGEYTKAQADYWAAKPVKEITYENYEYMLEVLPPKSWVTIDGVNEFLMIEHETGPYTRQCATVNGKFYTKVVNAYDRSTWIHNFIKADCPTV